jgi:hypothetical protein
VDSSSSSGKDGGGHGRRGEERVIGCYGSSRDGKVRSKQKATLRGGRAALSLKGMSESESPLASSKSDVG